MDHINLLQVGIFVVIGGLLVAQAIAMHKGYFVKEHCSRKKRFHNAVIASFVPIIMGVVMQNWYLAVVGVVGFFYCYFFKQWYTFKRNP